MNRLSLRMFTTLILVLLVVGITGCSAPASAPSGGDNGKAAPMDGEQGDNDGSSMGGDTDTDMGGDTDMDGDTDTDTDTDMDGEGSMDMGDSHDASEPMTMTMTMHMSGGSNSAAYMMLENSSDTPDALISARTEVAQTVELHTVINEEGVMKMRPVPQIDVPANGSQQLKPGGYHVMLLGITQDLKEGDSVDLTLNFERAGKVTITAPVAMMQMDDDTTAEPFVITHEHLTITNPWVRAAVMTQNTAPMTSTDSMTMTMDN